MSRLALDLTYWDAQIEALCGQHDVVAFDLPGHGRSPGVPPTARWRGLRRRWPGVVRSVGESAHLVGLSVGMISQATALAAPDLVRSLTLIDTAAAFTDEARAGMRTRAGLAREGGMVAVLPSTLTRGFTQATVARRRDLVERVSRTPLVHAAMWDMISALDLVADLPRIACPALILVGAHDPSPPVAAARALHAGIAGSEMHVIADASHMAPLEQPGAINRHLSAFLPR